MIYECEVKVRDPRFIKLFYKESIQLHKSYNLFVRISQKLQFYADDNLVPIGYLSMDGLEVKAVKQWNEQTIKQQAKLTNKIAKRELEKKEFEEKQNKQKKEQKQSKHKRKSNRRSSHKIQEEQFEEVLINSQAKNTYQGFYNFVVFKNGQKQQDDILILDIHSQSRIFKKNMQKLATSNIKASSNPLTYQPNKQFNTSLMSSENPQQRYRGFLNLAMLLLIVLNIRNIVDNFERYGIRQWPTLNMPRNSSIYLLFGLGFHLGFTYMMTYLQFKKVLPSRLCVFLNILNIFGILISNAFFTIEYNSEAISSVLLSGFACIIHLKLISYVHFNQNLFRLAQIPQVDQFVKGEVKRNINNLTGLVTIKRLAYFTVIPTLCYQLQYPKNSYIRKGWLAKRIVQYMVTTVVMNIIIIQYIHPKLQDIKIYYESPEFKFFDFGVGIMQLSVPVMLYWVLMFYSIFQVLLNILAQITCFGDRLFYLDWWNCKDHQQYWKKWNLPVHHWMLRHIYLPLTGLGVSKAIAGFIVFFVSALYHEYLVGVPLHILSYWAFIAMMSQSPLIIFQKVIESKLRIRNSELGNLVFWISFCFVGQPIVVFAYYYLCTTKS